MEDSSIANNGGLIKYNNSGDSNNFALIAILVTFIAILVTIYCSNQFYPNDLDPSNFCHSKNQSTQTDQTDQIRQRDLGVQTAPCSQSSRASQTAYYSDITSRLRPLSDETTTAKRLTKLKPDYDGPSSRASQTACYLDITSRLRPFSDETTTAKRLTKLKPDYDGPIIHGPFSCDCPGDGCIFRS